MHYQRTWQPIANLLSLLFNTFNSWVQSLPMDAPPTQGSTPAGMPTQEQLQAAYDAQLQAQARLNTIPKDNQLAAAAAESTNGTPTLPTKGKNKVAGSTP